MSISPSTQAQELSDFQVDLEPVEPETSREKKKLYILLLVSILVIIISVIFEWHVLQNGGLVDTQEIVLKANGSSITALLQIPHGASAINKVPGIVYCHGSGSNKEQSLAFSIELSRRGFCVLSIDALGHGNSDPRYDRKTHLGGEAGLIYLQSHAYVNGRLGAIGHSMGSGIMRDAVIKSGIPVDALVLLGGGLFGNDVKWLNDTRVRNVLAVIGLYDELFDIPALKNALKKAWSPSLTLSTPESFLNGTAHDLCIVNTNHLFEPVDPTAISKTIDWFADSLRNTLSLPSSSLVYYWFIVCGFLACVGLVCATFAVILLAQTFIPWLNDIVQVPTNAGAKDEDEDIPTPGRTIALRSVIYCAMELGTFGLFAFIGWMTPWPQRYGGIIDLWLVGNGTVELIVLYFMFKGNWHRYLKVSWSHVVKATLIALIGILFMVAIVWPVDVFLFFDFSFYLPLMQDLTPLRIAYAFLNLPFALIYFIVDGAWLATLRPISKSKIGWFFYAYLLKVFPFVLLILIQAIGSAAIGGPLISGMFGFVFLFLYSFLLFFLWSTIASVLSLVHTNSVYVGGVFIAITFSWAIAALLPI